MISGEELERVEQLKRAELYLCNAIEELMQHGYDVNDLKLALNITNEQDIEDYLSWFDEPEAE